MPDDFKNRAILEALAGRETASVLDLGCGRGEYARFLMEEGFNVVSVDIEKAADGGLPNFAVADAVRLPFKENHFDLVFAFDVIEHVPDAESAFIELKRVLRDDGRILASVPNDSIIPRLYFKLTSRKPPSRDDPTHVRFHNYSKWRKLFSKNFSVRRVFGQWFTEDGPAFKRSANKILSKFYCITPNIYFLLGK